MYFFLTHLTISVALFVFPRLERLIVVNQKQFSELGNVLSPQPQA